MSRKHFANRLFSLTDVDDLIALIDTKSYTRSFYSNDYYVRYHLKLDNVIIDIDWNVRFNGVESVIFFRRGYPLYAPQSILFRHNGLIDELWDFGKTCEYTSDQIIAWLKNNNINRPISKRNQILMKLSLL